MPASPYSLKTGDRVRYANGDFQGTIIAELDISHVLVRWDTHFGVSDDRVARELLIQGERERTSTADR